MGIPPAIFPYVRWEDPASTRFNLSPTHTAQASLRKLSKSEEMENPVRVTDILVTIPIDMCIAPATTHPTGGAHDEKNANSSPPTRNVHVQSLQLLVWRLRPTLFPNPSFLSDRVLQVSPLGH